MSRSDRKKRRTPAERQALEHRKHLKGGHLGTGFLPNPPKP